MRNFIGLLATAAFVLCAYLAFRDVLLARYTMALAMVLCVFINLWSITRWGKGWKK